MNLIDSISGSSEYPLIICANKGEEVIFDARQKIVDEKVSNSDPVKSKLPKNIADKVYNFAK